MSLEQGCRLRLLKTEDGRRAVELLDRWDMRLTALEAVLEAVKAGWTLELQGPRPGINQNECRGWIEPTVPGSEHLRSVYAASDEPGQVLSDLGIAWKERNQ